MKKLLSLLICATLIVCVLAGCAKSNERTQDELDALRPSESVNYEELMPIDEFPGTFQNDEYTVVAEQVSDQIMKFTVTSAITDDKGYEWQMSGYFSEQTYRINYTDSAKYAVTYDENGQEISRTAEYENGSGRMQFDGKDKLLWNENYENRDGKIELERAEG